MNILTKTVGLIAGCVLLNVAVAGYGLHAMNQIGRELTEVAEEDSLSGTRPGRPFNGRAEHDRGQF